MSRELALQVRDLNVWYRPGGVIRRSRLVPVLHDISFDLWRGEALGLVGESGSGKSTLARTILGMVPDYTGTVTLHLEAADSVKKPARNGPVLP